MGKVKEKEQVGILQTTENTDVVADTHKEQQPSFFSRVVGGIGALWSGSGKEQPSRGGGYHNNKPPVTTYTTTGAKTTEERFLTDKQEKTTNTNTNTNNRTVDFRYQHTGTNNVSENITTLRGFSRKEEEITKTNIEKNLDEIGPLLAATRAAEAAAKLAQPITDGMGEIVGGVGKSIPKVIEGVTTIAVNTSSTVLGLTAIIHLAATLVFTTLPNAIGVAYTAASENPLKFIASIVAMVAAIPITVLCIMSTYNLATGRASNSDLFCICIFIFLGTLAILYSLPKDAPQAVPETTTTKTK